MGRRKIYFVCTGNSARSQMAEGFARQLLGDAWEVHSAGLEPSGVHPLAVRVMAEAGVDISGHRSKLIDPAQLRSAQIVVTLCGDAEERCPATPPGVMRLHWPLVDPVRAGGSDDERLAVFRRVRDQVRELVERLARDLGGDTKDPAGCGGG